VDQLEAAAAGADDELDESLDLEPPFDELDEPDSAELDELDEPDELLALDELSARLSLR
jgi:hypothetical protein